MARLASGTKEGDIATAKWKKTMEERYGDISVKMSEEGRKGGLKSRGGGFATRTVCNCDAIDGLHIKPQCAGAIGGATSRRGKNEGR